MDAKAPKRQIQLVIKSTWIRNNDDLNQFYLKDSVTGTISPAPSSFWGSLADMLRNQNSGAELSTAWELDELRAMPSATAIFLCFLGSGVGLCLGAVGTIVLYRKRRRALT